MGYRKEPGGEEMRERWIRTDPLIHQHINTKKLAVKMGVSPRQAADYWIRLQGFAWGYCSTGNLNKYSDEDIEFELECSGSGLMKALRETGWVSPDGWIKQWRFWGGKEFWETYNKNKPKYPQYKPLYEHYKNDIEETMEQLATYTNLSQPSATFSTDEIRGDEIRGDENSITKEFNLFWDKYIKLAKKNDWTIPSPGKKTLMRTHFKARDGEITGGIASNIDKIFSIILSSDFLMGKVPPTNGNVQFRMSIDFLLARKTRLMDILEGKYSRHKAKSISFRDLAMKDLEEEEQHARDKGLAK